MEPEVEKKKTFIESMLTGVAGGISSKRVITFIAFLLCCVAFLFNVFGEIPLQKYIWDGMLYLVGAGLGFSTIEHFSKK
jgi:hypothetical protein